MDLVEKVARAMCGCEGTSQCAAICLSRFASSNRDGQCPDAVRVWGQKARAAIARAEKAEREMDGEIDKNKELRKSRASAFCEIDNAAYNYAALAARVKALEEALEPFARADLLHIDGWDDADGIELTFDGYAIDRVTVATIRRARALLAQREGG